MKNKIKKNDRIPDPGLYLNFLHGEDVHFVVVNSISNERLNCSGPWYDITMTGKPLHDFIDMYKEYGNKRIISQTKKDGQEAKAETKASDKK